MLLRESEKREHVKKCENYTYSYTHKHKTEGTCLYVRAADVSRWYDIYILKYIYICICIE